MMEFFFSELLTENDAVYFYWSSNNIYSNILSILTIIKVIISTEEALLQNNAQW